MKHHKDISKSRKWIVLALACAATLGGYYSFDFPSALHNPLRRHFNMSPDKFEFHFSLLYSLYSMPNIIIPGFGGILSDVLGNDRVMLGCATLVLLGNVLLFIACLRTDLVTLEIGRFVFGLGAETLQVCANTVIAKWFHGAELALALGINLSACKLGGVLTDWASPFIAKNYGVVAAAGVVTSLCLICFVLAIVLVYYDSNGSLVELMHPFSARKHRQPDYQSIPHGEQDNRITNQPSSLSTHNDHIEMATIGDSNEGRSDKSEDLPSDAGTFSFSHFNACVWLLFVVTFIMYGVFVPFNNIANGVLLETFFEGQGSGGDSNSKEEVIAARLQSIPYFLSVLITPFLGWGIDKFGYRSAQLVLSALLLFLAHSTIYSADFVGPVVPLVLIGLAYSIFGSVSWACVPLIVPDYHHGAAYGVMCAFQNAGQSFTPLLLQYIIRNSGHFRDCELLLAGMAITSLVLCAVLYVVDYTRNGNILQVSTV